MIILFIPQSLAFNIDIKAPVTDNITYKTRLIMAGMALPAFHTLGIIVHLLVGIYAMTPVSLYPPIATKRSSMPMMPTPDNILHHMVQTRSNCLLIIPALLQIWAQDKKAVDYLASLEFVVSLFLSSPDRPVLTLFIGLLRRIGPIKTWQFHDRIRSLYHPGLRSH